MKRTFYQVPFLVCLLCTFSFSQYPYIKCAFLLIIVLFYYGITKQCDHYSTVGSCRICMHFVYMLHDSVCLWPNYDNIVIGIIFDGNIYRQRCVQDTQVCEGMRFHTQVRAFIVTGICRKVTVGNI
jgi:hypothetical protein